MHRSLRTLSKKALLSDFERNIKVTKKLNIQFMFIYKLEGGKGSYKMPDI